MARDIPSLNAIRFFESAARHLSFTRAGEELFVTQSAVSRQIKLLEEQLNCELFARSGPNLRLTSHGEAFQQTVSYALDVIRHGVGDLRRDTGSSLTVSILPSFAVSWLIPRMPLLEEMEPSLSIRLESSFSNIDFALRTDVDVAIRLGRGSWPGLYAEQITRDNMMPVCAPELAGEIKTVADLSEQVLLVDDIVHDEWIDWFAAAKMPYQGKSYKHYNDTLIQIRAALRGQGVALCREELIRDYIEAGELVPLFEIDFASDLHYYFVCPEERTSNQKVMRFRDLLLQLAS